MNCGCSIDSVLFLQTWDEALAISARAWASNCIFKHNPLLQQPGRMHPTFTSVGENIWAGFPYTHFTIISAIKSWADEVTDYDYSSNKCTQVCGHYTQVCSVLYLNIVVDLHAKYFPS